MRSKYVLSNPSFVDCSRDAHIMIHEATFTDELKENAVNFMHSTVREAVEEAIDSNSQCLVLTHFSQRYAKAGITQTQGITDVFIGS